MRGADGGLDWLRAGEPDWLRADGADAGVRVYARSDAAVCGRYRRSSEVESCRPGWAVLAFRTSIAGVSGRGWETRD